MANSLGKALQIAWKEAFRGYTQRRVRQHSLFTTCLTHRFYSSSSSLWFRFWLPGFPLFLPVNLVLSLSHQPMGPFPFMLYHRYDCSSPTYPSSLSFQNGVSLSWSVSSSCLLLEIRIRDSSKERCLCASKRRRWGIRVSDLDLQFKLRSTKGMLCLYFVSIA